MGLGSFKRITDADRRKNRIETLKLIKKAFYLKEQNREEEAVACREEVKKINPIFFDIWTEGMNMMLSCLRLSHLTQLIPITDFGTIEELLRDYMVQKAIGGYRNCDIEIGMIVLVQPIDPATSNKPEKSIFSTDFRRTSSLKIVELDSEMRNLADYVDSPLLDPDQTIKNSAPYAEFDKLYEGRVTEIPNKKAFPYNTAYVVIKLINPDMDSIEMDGIVKAIWLDHPRGLPSQWSIDWNEDDELCVTVLGTPY